MRPIALALTLALAMLAAESAIAQQMPDASQMAGVPLPAGDLPPGTVTVRVMREQLGNNLAGQTVTLKVGADVRTAKTDEQGRAQFADLPPGMTVSAEAVVDGETLRSREFPVSGTSGIRVALIAGLAAAAERDRAARETAAKEPPRSGIVVFGGETRVILEFQDDNLQVFYLLDIVNAARTPIDTGEPLIIDLPEDATGASLMEGSSPLAGVQGDRITIRGPFPPGTTSVQIGYMLPYSGDSLTLEQKWPAVFEELFVAMEQVGAVKIESPQLTATQDAESNGARFIMGRGPRLNAGDTMRLNVSGLPHHDTTVRDVGLVVGLLMLAIGIWAGVTGAPARRNELTTLRQRKDKLFADLVDLEEKHRAGRISESRYAGKRRALVTELERVIGELDREPTGGGEGLAA